LSNDRRSSLIVTLRCAGSYLVTCVRRVVVIIDVVVVVAVARDDDDHHRRRYPRKRDPCS